MKTRFLWIALSIIGTCSTRQSYCQDTLRKIVPDGTQGEFQPSIDSLAEPKRKKTWNEFYFRYTTLRIGVGMLYEFAAYAQDDNSKKQMDSLGTPLDPLFKVRDFRILVSGNIKSKRTITWKAGLLYDGPSRSWLMRESGVMVDVPELKGNIFVGRTKEGFSLNKVMNGYAGWTMERQMALDVIPILADGIKWVGYAPKSHLIWNVGAYTAWLSKGQSFSNYAWQVAARVAWVSDHTLTEKKLLHLGGSIRYGKPVDGKMRLRSRPEANPAPYFIDTQTFPSDESIHIGYEAYYTSGPLMLGSEYYFHKFNSSENTNPLFKGGDFVISYMLTGESRP